MYSYILRRLMLMAPTLVGVSIILFTLINLLPGGPVEQAIMAARFGGGGGEMGATSSSSANMDEEYLQALNEYYGYDKPPIERYFHWIGNVLQGDLGTSYRMEEPVTKVIKSRFPVSLTFGVTSLILIYFICIPLGIIKAVKHGTWFDYVTSVMIFMGYAIPGYAFFILLLVLFGGGTWLDIFPLQGFHSSEFESLSLWGKMKDIAYHMTLPLIAFSTSLFAFNTMLMKNSLIEHLTSDYVRTAYAKGLRSRMVIFGHALQNALIPIATGFGRFLTFFFAGSLLIETIGGIEGMGKLFFDSLIDRDYPVVMGLVLITSFATILGQLLADIAYTIVDPRIDFN